MGAPRSRDQLGTGAERAREAAVRLAVTTSARNAAPMAERVAFLDSVRVIDVSILAPTMLGMHLADLGADVVKIEDPVIGDYLREVWRRDGEEVSAVHRRWNRGKRSVALDLRCGAGVDVLRRLVATADIVVEGMRPGSLERRGVGAAALMEINPRLVFVTLSGFGATGPYAPMATHGPAFDAYAGLLAPRADDEGNLSIPPHVAIGVQAGPMLGAMAALAAVINARASGRGAVLDISQADAAAYWNVMALENGATDRWRAESGQPPLVSPDGQPSVRCQFYATSDGRVVLFMALERKFAERFTEVAGRADLLALFSDRHFDHQFGDAALRRALVEVFAQRTQAEWLELCQRADVPLVPVNIGVEALDDPHFQQRTRWLDPESHRTMLMAMPVHGDAVPPDPSPAPALGEHTAEVLQDLLGLDDSALSQLRRQGAFGEAAAGSVPA